MKTGYILIDLDSFILTTYIESRIKYDINTRILHVLKSLQPNDKGFELKIILISNDSNLILLKEKQLLYRKDISIKMAVDYSILVEVIKKVLKKENLGMLTSINDAAPFPIGPPPHTYFNLDLLSQSLKVTALACHDLFVITANRSFADNLAQLGIASMLTYRDCDLDSNDLVRINALCELSNVNLRLFLDIDETLLRHQKSKCLKQTMINDPLVKYLCSLQTKVVTMHSSFLTARTNPCVNFNRTIKRCRQMIKQSDILQQLLAPALPDDDIHDCLVAQKKARELSVSLAEIVENINEYSQRMGMLNIKKTLDNFDTWVSNNRYSLAETVKNCIQEKYGLEIQLESFSFVDLQNSTKAQVIDANTSVQTNNNGQVNVVLYCDDSDYALKEAAELQLAHKNIIFVLLPSRKEGSLEVNYKSKIKSFLDALKLHTPSSVSTETTPDIHSFWKKRKISPIDNGNTYEKSPPQPE